MTDAAGTWIPSTDDFGTRLALIRHRMGWNMKEAAKECGFPAASWRAWEADGVFPRNFITIAMAIATRTGCNLDWLVYGPLRPTTAPAPIATQTTAEYLRRDPLAARIVASSGDVRHGDGRKKAARDLRVPVQSGRNRSTSTHGKRPVSRASAA